MNIALRLPNSLGSELKTFAKKEEISMNQFISTAVAEKMSAVKTYDYLEARSKKGSFKHLRKLLDKVPNKKPEAFDIC